MKRARWKLPFIHSSLMKFSKINKNKSLFSIRYSQIPPYFLGRRIRLYNGAWFLVQTVSAPMIGTKFGEYSLTRRFNTQKQLKKKKFKKIIKKSEEIDGSSD